MLEFSRLTLENAPSLRPLFTHSYSRLCDYVYGTVLLWRDMWPMEFAVYGNILFLRMELSQGQQAYMLPVTDDLDKALDILDKHQNGAKLFINIPESMIGLLKQRYDEVEVSTIESGGDYIYDAETMATLTGRKLHGQRNHLNYFDRTWECHRMEQITKNNIQDVKVFIDRKAVTASSVLFQEGNIKTLEALDNLEAYNFSSMALYAEGKVIGFTLGTMLGDTLYVTIEQADRDYRGVYPKLASAFVAAHMEKGVKFVNREDDLGSEGLRKSKLAWGPCEIVERYLVSVYPHTLLTGKI